MTYWQKLISQYPEMEEYGAQSKDVKCPCTWGYEQKIKGQCLKMRSCEQCWNRQIPERKRA